MPDPIDTTATEVAPTPPAEVAGPFARLRRGLQALTGRLATGRELFDAMTDPTDVDEWIKLRRDLAALGEAVAYAAGELDHHIYAVLPSARHDVLTVGSAKQTPKPGRRKGWDTPALLRIAVQRAGERANLLDASTGERVTTPEAAMLEVLTECFTLTPKVTGVREVLGADPDAYSEQGTSSVAMSYEWAGDLLGGYARPTSAIAPDAIVRSGPGADAQPARLPEPQAELAQLAQLAQLAHAQDGAGAPDPLD